MSKKKISYNTQSNPNQMRLGEQQKTKREMCRFKDNCDKKKCPCQFFKMRF